jgi:hypothetical protein
MVRLTKQWYARNFQVISLDKAVAWKLSHVRNIYGDEINQLGCRSLWKDSKGRLYRVKTLQ